MDLNFFVDDVTSGESLGFSDSETQSQEVIFCF